MNILLIGEVFSENLGDQIVYYSNQYQLKEQFPNASFYVLDLMGRNHISSSALSPKSNKNGLLNKLKPRISSHILLKWISAFKKKKYYLSKIQRDIDLAVFVGGQLVSDTFATYIYAILKILNKYEIPVIFNAVGLGVLENRHAKKLYEKCLKFNCVKYISCRCDQERMNSFLFKEKMVQSTFDSAVLASQIYDIERDKSSKIIGLGIMKSSRYKEDDLIAYWSEIIKYLETEGIQWKVFTTGQCADYLLSEKILELNGFGDEKLLSRPEKPEELVAHISEFCGIISFRLHSHIIAYSLGIPSLAIVWDEKIRDFFKKVDLEKNVFQFNDMSILDNISDLFVEEMSEKEIKKNKQLSVLNLNNAALNALNVKND